MLRRMSTFATGLICGISAGVVIAVIVTPKSGEEIRQDWRRRLARSVQAAEERRQELQAELTKKTTLPTES